MKTLVKFLFVLIMMLGVSGLLMAQTRSGDRSKKTTGANSATPQSATDKKAAAEGEKSASTTPTKLEDNKSKDPLENMKFRNLGPAVGGGRVTSVVGIPGKPNVYYVGAAGGGVFMTQDGGLSWKAIFEKQPTASIGAIAGLLGAFAAARLLASLVWGMRATDPATLAASAAVLVCVAAAASIVPALRILRLNAADVLRQE